MSSPPRSTTEHHGSESMQTSESLQMAPSSDGSRAAAARVSISTALMPAAAKRPESLPRRSAEAEHRSVRAMPSVQAQATRALAAVEHAVTSPPRSTTEHHGSESMQTCERLQMAPSSDGSRAAAARVLGSTALVQAAAKRPESLPRRSTEAEH